MRPILMKNRKMTSGLKKMLHHWWIYLHRWQSLVCWDCIGMGIIRVLLRSLRMQLKVWESQNCICHLKCHQCKNWTWYYQDIINPPEKRDYKCSYCYFQNQDEMIYCLESGNFFQIHDQWIWKSYSYSIWCWWEINFKLCFGDIWRKKSPYLMWCTFLFNGGHWQWYQ